MEFILAHVRVEEKRGIPLTGSRVDREILNLEPTKLVSYLLFRFFFQNDTLWMEAAHLATFVDAPLGTLHFAATYCTWHIDGLIDKMKRGGGRPSSRSSVPWTLSNGQKPATLILWHIHFHFWTDSWEGPLCNWKCSLRVLLSLPIITRSISRCWNRCESTPQREQCCQIVFLKIRFSEKWKSV